MSPSLTSNVFSRVYDKLPFFHDVSLEDDRYGVGKDVVDDKLTSIGGDEDDVVEGHGENLDVQKNEVEHSLEELFDPL